MILFAFFALILSIPALQTGSPNRQPQMAARGGDVALVFGSGKSILCALSHDKGRTFGRPVEVAHSPDLALGRHRGPRVAFSGTSIVVTAIGTPSGDTQSHAPGSVGDLLAWRSDDGGQTWSEPVRVNDVPNSAREGLHNIAVSDRTIGAVWLDLRAKGTRLYGSYSTDSGRTWSKNVLLYQSPEATICQCCHPSIAAGEANAFVVMFRNVVGETRDMYAMTWTAGEEPSTPQKQGAEQWTINACPMDGGGVGWQDNQIVSAWRSEHTVHVVDHGKDLAFGDGKDVALTVSRQGPTTAWVAPAGTVQVRKADGSINELGTGSFPTIVGLPDGSVVAAWERDGAIEVAPVN